jgi:hypothetical protein
VPGSNFAPSRTTRIIGTVTDGDDRGVEDGDRPVPGGPADWLPQAVSAPATPYGTIFSALRSPETLPGYTSNCDGTREPAWLSANRSGFDLVPGQSVTVTVTLDSAKGAQPGTFTGSLFTEADTPYPVTPVDVTMTVTPPSTWGCYKAR